MTTVILDKNLIDDLPNLKKNVGKATQNAKTHNPNFLDLLKIRQDSQTEAGAVFSVAPIQQELDDLYDILNATNTVDLSLSGTTVNISNGGNEASIDLHIYRIDVLWWSVIKWAKKELSFRDANYFGLKDVVNVSLVGGVGSYDIGALIDARDEIVYVEAVQTVFPYNTGKMQKKTSRPASEYDDMVKKIFRNIIVP